MLELEHRFRVVDVNARLDTGGSGDPSSAGRTITPDRLEREMHQAGVVRSVVYAGPPDGDDYLSANNAVARYSAERPFVAFARINGSRDPGDGAASRLQNFASSRKDHHTSPDDVEKYAYDDRFHGFKVDPASDGLPDDDVLDQLEDVGLPVLVEGGVDFPPESLPETLLGYGFPVILEQFGGHPLQRDLMETAIDMLAHHDDLHLDTSFVRYRDQLERALMEHPDRVCFGSGAPAAHPNVGVMELLTLDVPEDAMRKAFSKNVERLLPSSVPGADS